MYKPLMIRKDETLGTTTKIRQTACGTFYQNLSTVIDSVRDERLSVVCIKCAEFAAALLTKDSHD